jgi:hypothetical protein
LCEPPAVVGVEQLAQEREELRESDGASTVPLRILANRRACAGVAQERDPGTSA